MECRKERISVEIAMSVFSLKRSAAGEHQKKAEIERAKKIGQALGGLADATERGESSGAVLPE